MSVLAHKARDERGFTLVEVLAATVILIVGILGTVTLVNYANSATLGNQNRNAANSIARQILDTTRQIPYSAVNNAGLASTLQNYTLTDGSKPLADSEPGTSGWQIDRLVRQPGTICPAGQVGTASCVTFTVTTNVTLVSPQNYNRVTVTVTAPANIGVNKPVTASAIVADSRSSGGSGGGSSSLANRAILQTPACTGCNAAAWTYGGEVAPCFHFTSTVGTDNCLPTYNGASGANYSGNNITSIPVKTIWETSPASVKFYLEQYQSSYPSPPTETLLGNGTVNPTDGTVYTYTWNLANTYPNQTSDGGYAIKAVAYDSGSVQIGDPQLMTFWLNRFVPDLSIMGSPVAGKDALFSSFPQVEWLPFKSGGRIDYDYTGFKIYRNGTLVSACNNGVSGGNPSWSAQVDLTTPGLHYAHQAGPPDRCQDSGAPGSGSVTYTIGVLNMGPDGVLATSEGGNVQTSANVNAAPADTRPSPPTGFTAVWQKDSANAWVVKLNWTAPAARGDADAGDCVMSYHIYYTTTTGASTPTLAQSYYRTDTGVGNATSPCWSTGTTQYLTGYTVNGAGVYAKPPPSSNVSTKFFIASVDTKLNESTVASVILAPHP